MAKSQAGDAQRDDARGRLMTALAEPLPPVRVGFLYVLGLLVISIVMVLLPLVYLAIVAATCYALFYHATENITLFEEVRGRSALLWRATWCTSTAPGTCC